MEIIQGMYGLPKVKILAKNLLVHRFHNHGYYQVKRTPGLSQYVWIPIYFTLVFEDFGIGYVGR